MRMVSRMSVLYHCLVIVLCAMLLRPATAEAATEQAFQSAKPGVVKIRVEGANPVDKPKRIEGSGFIVYSDKGLTLLITAAHVIGSSQTTQSLNPDWLVNDLEQTVKRTIKIDVLDANGVLVEKSAAAVLGQDDKQDIAVLEMEGSNFKTLEGVYELQELQGHLSNVLAIGYKKGERQIGFHSGMGSLESSTRFGRSFTIDSKIDAGRSGGPILDLETGKVVAIVSQDLGSLGRHEAVPVAFALPILNIVFGDRGIPFPISRASPTPQDKIGIWVARFRGDDKEKDFPAQRDVVGDLVAAVDRRQELKDRVEIRELPYAVSGGPEDVREREVMSLGEQHNASVVLWGDITGIVANEVFRPRVTIMKKWQEGLKAPTILMKPITKIVREEELRELTSIPDTAYLPPERIQAPLKLVRYIVALAYFSQIMPKEAAQHFDEFITEGISSNVRVPVVYLYSALSHFIVYRMTGEKEALAKAHVRFEETVQQARTSEEASSYAAVLRVVSSMYRVMVQTNVDPEENRKRARQRLEELVSILDQQQVSQSLGEKEKKETLAFAKKYLGVTYQELAMTELIPDEDEAKIKEEILRDMGLTDVQGLTDVVRLPGVPLAGMVRHYQKQYLTLSVKALEGATVLYEEQQNWEHYARAQNLVGPSYEGLAILNVEPYQNRINAIRAFQNAARVRKEQKDWDGYASVQYNLGIEYEYMAESGMDKEKNMELARNSYEESSRASYEANNQIKLDRAKAKLRTLFEK
ncbi:MAG: serine protease [Nitrospira sp.]|nr:serine protease [Nitrospira sp.]